MEDLILNRMLRDAETNVDDHLKRHYPIGTLVAFDLGRARLHGEVLGYGYYWANLGDLVVRIQKRNGEGHYTKYVCPATSPSFEVVRFGPQEGGA